jgi:putative transposase
VLLEVAGLARSTFFYHQAKLAQPDPRADLKAAIAAVFQAAYGRYGHRRVHAALTRQGWSVAPKTVLKIMREQGLVCKVRRRRRYASYRGQVGAVAPNTLARAFTATAPNRKWVTDLTEFRIGDTKVYLSAIMDLFDRSIVAHSSGTSPSVALTNESLRRALATIHDGEGPLVHSDQGFQYQHLSWQHLLASAHATQSMSRKANCLDNAVMENFFGHLKEEMFHHDSFSSAQQFTSALDEYIHWYNTERISTKLEGLSPAQYRTQALAA